MINENIELLIDDVEIEESLASMGAGILAYGAVSAGAPLAVGYGILAVPVVYSAYKLYKFYRDKHKAAKTAEEKRQLKVKLTAAKLKFEKVKQQEIAKRRADHQPV